MKKLVMSVVSAVLIASVSGCICDGTERSFREVDRKYADSGWTAFAFVPVIGWITLPFLSLNKHGDYQKVLLKKPADDAHETIRWTNRFEIIYCPDEI